MTTPRMLKCLLIAVLLASGVARAADSNIVIAMEDSKQLASFTVANLHCVLKDGQIRCTPVSK